MTVSSTITRTSYAGNGSTKDFAIPFMFMKNGDLEVVLRNTEDKEKLLSFSTDYTLAGAGEQYGGTCSMVVAPALGNTLVIRRNPAIVQEVDYLENDAFPAQSHESALDLLTMICQSLSERLDRTISLKVSSSVTGIEIPDPDPGLALVWNEAGDNLTNKELVGAGLIGLPLDVSKGGTGVTSVEEIRAMAMVGTEPADPTLLKSGKSNQSLETAFAEPYVDIADDATPAIDLTARNRFTWTLGADRTFPALTPAVQGEWHFNVYPGAHAFTLDATWAGKTVGEIQDEATMHRLALVNDGISLTLSIDNRGA